MAIEVGIKNRQSEMVTEELLATKIRSGAMEVFATPALLALAEWTCAQSVQDELPDSQTTVGIGVDLKHVSSTPAGMEVRCESELVAVDRRKLTFTFKVYDAYELIGEGTHDRFIIDRDKFQAKADRKLAGE